MRCANNLILFIFLLIVGALGASSRNEPPNPSVPVRNDRNDNGRFGEDTDDNITEVIIHDNNGDICLQAHLSMEVFLEEDDFEEEETRHKEWHEICVRTAKYEGICEGDQGLLIGENVTGPAIAFTGNATNREEEILLLWRVDDEETFLDTVIIKLKIPNRDGSGERHLKARIEKLRLFPSSVGSGTLISSEKVNVSFSDTAGGMIVFKDGDYVIGTVMELSLLTVLALVGLLIIFISIGTVFYVRGNHKKWTNSSGPDQP